MKRTLAIFGAGGWGWNWTERSLHDTEWDVLAYVDSNPNTLAKIADRGVPRERLFSDAETALDAVRTDAVTVTIPNPARVPILQRALEEGRHILADKPLVHTPADLAALLKTGCRRKSVFMVAQNYRFFLGPRIVRQWLDGGRYGPVGGMHVRFLRQSSLVYTPFLRSLPGAIPLGLEMLIHQFDLMRFFLRSEPVSVSATGSHVPWSLGEGFDALDVHVEFANGVHVSLDADWSATYSDTDWPGHWEIVLRDGTISIGNPGRSWRVHNADGVQAVSDAGPDGSTDTTQSMDQVWREFKDAIGRVEAGKQSPAEVFCSLEDNARSLAMAMAADRSAEFGATVDYAAFVKANRIAPK